MSEKLILLFTSDILSFDATLQAEIYDDYYNLVYDLVFYMVHDHATTKDVIQEAFMKAIQNPPKYLDAATIKGWLKRLTRNTTLNYLRKNRKSRDELKTKGVYIEETASVFNHHPSVEQEVERKILLEFVVNEVRQQSPEYKQIIDLKYVHELSYKEISEQLGITDGAVRQRLARARASIRKVLKKEWGADI